MRAASRCTRHGRRGRAAIRSGTAAVEFALVAPVLLLFFALAADQSRAYYHLQILTIAARNGAAFASDLRIAQSAKENDVLQFVRASLGPIADQCTVEVNEVQDSAGHDCAEVRVNCQFRSVIALPGLDRERSLLSTARMRLTPSAKKKAEED